MSLYNRLKVLLPTGTKEGARSFILTCPSCQSKDKLWMIKDTGRWICWKCHAQNPYGFSGSRPEFILNQILGQSVQDIQSLLYGEDGIVYKELDTGKESIFDEDQTEVEIQTEL